jgi:hypothetical protein
MNFALEQSETPAADLMTVSEVNRAKESMESKKDSMDLDSKKESVDLGLKKQSIELSKKSCLESQETVKHQSGPTNFDDI